MEQYVQQMNRLLMEMLFLLGILLKLQLVEHTQLVHQMLIYGKYSLEEEKNLSVNEKQENEEEKGEEEEDEENIENQLIDYVEEKNTNKKKERYGN